MDKKRDWFENWLFVNPDRLMELFEVLPPDLVEKLDYSVNSLIIFEQYLLENYTYDSIIQKENQTFLDNLSRYVGEVARRNLKNAIWNLNLKDKKDIYYNIPIITTLHIFRGMFCPLYTITTALDRRKGNYIFSNVQGAIDSQNQQETNMS